MRAACVTLALLLAPALAAQEPLPLAVGITPAQNIFNPAKAALERATGRKLVLLDARSPAAWELLDQGKVEAATGGLTWADWVASLKAKGLRVPAEGEVRRYQIGTDQIQVLTHGATVVMTLDQAQLAGIFSGRIRNWQEVGGDDAPIRVVLDRNQIATNDTFHGQILPAEAFRADTLAVPAGRTLVQFVEDTPNAIGFAPKASIRSQRINSPVTPEVSRPILLLIKGQTPTPGVAKLLAFLASPEGQALVIK